MPTFIKMDSWSLSFSEAHFHLCLLRLRHLTLKINMDSFLFKADMYAKFDKVVFFNLVSIKLTIISSRNTLLLWFCQSPYENNTDLTVALLLRCTYHTYLS